MMEAILACRPELVMLGFAVLLIVIETAVPAKGGRAKGYVALLGAAIAFPLLKESLGLTADIFSGAWVNDNFALVFKSVLLLGALLVIFLSLDEQTGSDRTTAGEFYILVLLAVLGMMIMVSGANLIVIYLGLELMAISFYILAGFSWFREESAEGALKYVLTGLFASALLMYGMSLIYGASGTVDLAELRVFFETGGAADYSRAMVLAGVAFLACGLAFKIGAAPFHMWMPDVLEGAPTSVAGFLAVGPKVAVLAIAARLFLTSLSGFHGFWVPLLWGMAALTIIWGNFAAIAQSSVKRMLAYSSVSHVGYLLIALISASSRLESAMSALVFYLVAYTFMNLGAFGTLLWMEMKTGEAVSWKSMAGMNRRAPVITVLWTIFMFALAGIPPLAGFIGKFWIFMTAWKAGFPGLVFIAIGGSLAGAFYYLRTIYAVYMLPAEGEEQKPALELSPLFYALVLTAAGTLAVGFVPRVFMTLTAGASPF
jgi:NADH-quinone oxidoreductase subunit N